MAKVLGNLEIDNGNLGVNTSNPLKSIQVGGGTTSEVVRVYYSDSSYIDITGFGLEMARAASYIRPNTDKNRSLYLGNDGKTWDTIYHNASVTTFVTDTIEHMRINSSGNVGIGTTTPVAKLDVRGDVALEVMGGFQTEGAIRIGRSDGTSRYHEIIAYNDSITENNYLRFDVHNGTVGSTTSVLTLKGNGNVGIGTTTPAGKLSVVDNTNTLQFAEHGSSDIAELKIIADAAHDAAIYFGDTVDSVRGGIYYDTSLNNMQFRGYNNATRMIIDSGGNVGIGTGTPDEKLHIVGDLKVDSDIPRIYLSDSSHNPDFSIGNVNGNFFVFDDTNSAYRLYVSSTGNVGIGTSLPAALLDVNGTAQMSTGITENVHYVGGSIQHWGDSGTGLYFETDELRFYTGGAEEMRLENDGDLHVDGDVIAYSTTVSDERLKDDIQTIDNACKKVCSLRGVEYTWNNGSRKGQREIGVIAQEVEKVIPEIVREKKLSLVDDEVYKTVDYEKLVAVLIEANKELCDRVSKLESKLDGITE